MSFLNRHHRFLFSLKTTKLQSKSPRIPSICGNTWANISSEKSFSNCAWPSPHKIQKLFSLINFSIDGGFRFKCLVCFLSCPSSYWKRCRRAFLLLTPENSGILWRMKQFGIFAGCTHTWNYRPLALAWHNTERPKHHDNLSIFDFQPSNMPNTMIGHVIQAGMAWPLLHGSMT